MSLKKIIWKDFLVFNLIPFVTNILPILSQVDFANHEECQEFYKNYEQCKASQQLMKYHMDILSQAQTPERFIYRSRKVGS